MKGIGSELIKAAFGLLFFITVLSWAIEFITEFISQHDGLILFIVLVLLGCMAIKWLINRTGGGGGGLLFR